MSGTELEGPETMTIQEAADHAGVTTTAVHQWINRGKVRVVQRGKRGARGVATTVDGSDVRREAARLRDELQRRLSKIEE